MPTLRRWQSSKLTQQAFEMGFDILNALARAKEPQSLGDLHRRFRWNEVQRGVATNVLLALHKTGNIEGDKKVSRIRLIAETTKISITPSGRQILKESRSRIEFGRRMLENS